MDFVCWGSYSTGTRMATAYAGGKWSSTDPSSCAPAIADHAIQRIRQTDGRDASSYDTVSPPSPLTCTP